MNKLGEYMVAGASRRRSIIAAQREPKPFITPRYTEVQNAAAEFLVTGDPRVLAGAEERLRTAVIRSKWDRERVASCTTALASFRRIAASILPPGVELRLGDPAPPRMVVSGVQVSVRPEVLLASGAENGAVKLCLTKNYLLSPEAGRYVGTCLHQYLEGLGVSAAPALCLVVDVFQGVVHTAPRAFRRRRQDIEAACQEIAHGWNPGP